jgi:hypothetical protein
MTFFNLNVTKICDVVTVNMTDKCQVKVDRIDQSAVMLQSFFVTVATLSLAFQVIGCSIEKGRKYAKCHPVLVVNAESQDSVKPSRFSWLKGYPACINAVSLTVLAGGLAGATAATRYMMTHSCGEVVAQIDVSCQAGLQAIIDAVSLKP